MVSTAVDPESVEGIRRVAERLAGEILSLPMYPGITAAQQERESGSDLPPTPTSAQVGTWYWDFEAGVFSVDARWCAATRVDPCIGPDHLERWAREIHPDDVGRILHGLEQLRVATPADAEAAAILAEALEALGDREGAALARARAARLAGDAR